MEEPRSNGSGRSSGTDDIRWWMRAGWRVKHLFPVGLKRLIRRRLPEWYYHAHWRHRDPYSDVEEVSSYPARVDVRLGIIREFAHIHRHYLGACRDLGVPYALVDITKPDWIKTVRDAGCDAFLVWPSVWKLTWKQAYDDRLRIMVEDMGQTIYPGLKELWLYESKRRMGYWLQANGFAHPRTWVFYRHEDALDFIPRAELPIVFKTDLGSGASGVKVLRTRLALRRVIDQCFGRGFLRTSGDLRDREWGCALLQEYIPDAREWRMIRVGDSFFGYERFRVGDFHSGSHAWDYSPPSDEMLNLLKDVTDRGGFTSMDLDVFISKDGRLLVSELQALFGMGNPYEMCMVDGRPGRMLHDAASGGWRFEGGRFCGNFMCNLRVAALLGRLGKPVPPGAWRVGDFEGVDVVEQY